MIAFKRLRPLKISILLLFLTTSCTRETIPPEIEQKMKEAYLVRFEYSDFIFDNEVIIYGTSSFTANDIEMKQDLGVYNECYVAILFPKGKITEADPNSSCVIDTPCGVYWSDIVAGISFGLIYSTGIVCYADDRLLYLREAYMWGYLRTNDIEEISMRLYGKISSIHNR
ncbi:MAG: hypothetical protein LBR37_01250 [Erysipelotrichaceae bacterium]|nr:hypothetical protein [Erysipelotrichaceae bacterium]